jgi:hypothetical protein
LSEISTSMMGYLIKNSIVSVNVTSLDFILHLFALDLALPLPLPLALPLPLILALAVVLALLQFILYL